MRRGAELETDPAAGTTIAGLDREPTASECEVHSGDGEIPGTKVPNRNRMTTSQIPRVSTEIESATTPAYAADDGPLTAEDIAQLREMAAPELPQGGIISTRSLL